MQADQRSVDHAGRIAFGVGCTILVFAGGVVAAFAGAITCHEDTGSGEKLPVLCGTIGSEPTVWLPAVIAPVCIVLLLIAWVTRKTMARASVALICIEIALIALWALASHGSITW